MDETSLVFAPSMPLAISVPTIAILGVVALYAAWQLRSPPASLVIFAAWLRYVVTIFHDFSFDRSPLGISWNAIISTSIVLIGIFVLRPKLLSLKILIPVYLIIVIGIVSAVINNDYSKILVMTTKTGYLLVIMLCSYEALMRHGERLFSWLIVAFIPPFVLQIISFLIGLSKAIENDGSISYIGGYSHEGAFSVVLATALMIACIVRSMSMWVRTPVIIGAVIGILLADYRTTIVSFVPFLLVCFLVGPLRQFSPPHRAIGLVLLGAVGLVTVAASADSIGERYGELAKIPEVPGLVVREPSDFNREQQLMLSTRVYLWSTYFYAWREGPPHYRLIGAGPEARIPNSIIYPHNTLISAVFEYGLIGLFAYLLLFIAPMIFALGAAPGDRARIIAAHVSFFLLNMATMPLWQIEGNILYGLLWGYTLYAVTRVRWPISKLLGPRRTMRPAWSGG